MELYRSLFVWKCNFVQRNILIISNTLFESSDSPGIWFKAVNRGILKILKEPLRVGSVVASYFQYKRIILGDELPYLLSWNTVTRGSWNTIKTTPYFSQRLAVLFRSMFHFFRNLQSNLRHIGTILQSKSEGYMSWCLYRLGDYVQSRCIYHFTVRHGQELI